MRRHNGYQMSNVLGSSPLEGGRVQSSSIQIATAFFRVAGGFWRGHTAPRAWLLTVAALILALANLFVQLGINTWNRFFFDALEKRNGAALLLGVWLILGLTLAGAICGVLFVHCRMRLQLRWREWLTLQLIGRWLGERRFYQLSIVEDEETNPEYRIADDTRMAIDPLVDFVIGLTNALLTATTFIGVLWVVGGPLNLGFLGRKGELPGYMVWSAVAYSLIASLVMVMIGKPLIGRVHAKNSSEAQFRYELTRIRESAETIALIGGDENERARLTETVGQVVERWIGVIVQQARMTWVSNANAVLAPVVPLLLCIPKYLGGELTLGTLMQIAAAFVQVQVSFNWLMENAIRIAEWLAAARRVLELTTFLDELDLTFGQGSKDTIFLGESVDDTLHIDDLSIMQKDGRLMIDGARVIIKRGEKILVKGGSGTGKSTLIRAMAGLWPWGSGRILRPRGASIAFLPQRPYVPLGTLRDVLLYPAPAHAIADDRLREILNSCGLSHLGGRLNDSENWARTLSGGELQRIAFARLLVQPPDIIIMDEATSALDEVSQANMMEFFRTDLANSMVLSVGHRPGLEAYHDREIILARQPGETHATAVARQYHRLSGFWSRIFGGH